MKQLIESHLKNANLFSIVTIIINPDFDFYSSYE